jgi:hypothetical protein
MSSTNKTAALAAAPAAPAPGKGRLYLGIAVFVFGWVLALTLVPVVNATELATSVKATLNTLLVVGCPKIFLVAAIAIMGKPGFALMKSAVFGFFKKFGPPAEVGPWRYRFGLVMFLLPFVLGLLLTYIGPVLPGGAAATGDYEMATDVLQVLSLFVLGGDFWDKLRALFVRDAKAQFPQRSLADAH